MNKSETLASPKAGEYLDSFYLIALSFFGSRKGHLIGGLGAFVLASAPLLRFRAIVAASVFRSSFGLMVGFRTWKI